MLDMGWNFRWTIVLLLLFVSQTFQLDNKNKAVFLDDICSSSNRTLTLSCQTASNMRSGSLLFQRYPSSGCTILIEVRSTSKECKEETDEGLQFGIYFNIRDLALLYDDILEVFEFYADDSQSDLSPRDLKVKSISGLDDTGLCHAKPSSCAQLLSRYSRPGPRLMLQFRQLSRRRPSHPSNTRLTTGPFRLDYTILTKHPSRARNELYCSALEGYLRPDLICSKEDRVHCPTSYKPSEGLNPASQADQGFPKREACRTSILTAEIILVAFASMLLITLIVFCCLFGFKRCEVRQQKSELCSLPSYRTATRPPHLATITAGASGNVESSDGRMNHAFDEILPHYEELFPPLRTEAGGLRAVISIENEATMYTY